MIDSIDDNFNKAQYEAHIEDYLDLNQDGHVGGGTPTTRLAKIHPHLSRGDKIFEIGSGGGDDALVLQSAGYEVTASDFTNEFVKVLKSKNLTAIQFDAKHDNLPGTYDAVYANAVFVHFMPEELENFLKRIKTNLTNDRVIFFSVIQGTGKERRTIKIGLERDFQYYSKGQLTDILQKAQYELTQMDLVDDRWLQVIAKAK